jgi:hypothetical protein
MLSVIVSRLETCVLQQQNIMQEDALKACRMVSAVQPLQAGMNSIDTTLMRSQPSSERDGGAVHLPRVTAYP